MAKVFEEIAINQMVLANRFVRSATWEGMAEKDGSVTPRLIDCMVALARGGVGLIISGYAFIRKDGQGAPRQLGVDRDELVPGLRKMAAGVHENNGKIVLQLAHGGFFAMRRLIGQTPLAPSGLPGIGKFPRREMTIGDIKELIAAFAEGAERAKQAGFDGVQMHAAHGYLLSQFLSPAFNRRTDEYGGTIENRARFLMETLRAIRLKVGAGYPVLIKMNARDFIANGLELNDSLKAASMLAKEGMDAIEISGGFLNGGKLNPSRSEVDSEEKEAYFREEARAFKKEISIPLILVGGNRSFAVAEQLVSGGVTDCISLSRPLIREPGLINRWKAGDLAKAKCISCNRCYGAGITDEGIYCVDEKRSAGTANRPAE
jgi:2,4-dienoyl-CoA reductase-like NADH-dependent reductase (Old Yellow Enzyme family)